MELQHHGIEGQHWGVRNGPPYPLDRRKDAIRRTKDFGKNNVRYAKSVGRSREYDKKMARYEKRGKTDTEKYNEWVSAAKAELKTQKMIEIQQNKIIKDAKKDGYIVTNIGSVKYDVRKPIKQALPIAAFGIPGAVIDAVITYGPKQNERTVKLDTYVIKAPKDY